jgi:hypothetical protein
MSKDYSEGLKHFLASVDEDKKYVFDNKALQATLRDTIGLVSDKVDRLHSVESQNSNDQALVDMFIHILATQDRQHSNTCMQFIKVRKY